MARIDVKLEHYFNPKAYEQLFRAQPDYKKDEQIDAAWLLFGPCVAAVKKRQLYE